jgi:hypothetical protein
MLIWVSVPKNGDWICYAIGEERDSTPEYDPFNPGYKTIVDNTTVIDSAEKTIFSEAVDYTKRPNINFIGWKLKEIMSMMQKTLLFLQSYVGDTIYEIWRLQIVKWTLMSGC